MVTVWRDLWSGCPAALQVSLETAKAFYKPQFPLISYKYILLIMFWVDPARAHAHILTPYLHITIHADHQWSQHSTSIPVQETPQRLDAAPAPALLVHKLIAQILDKQRLGVSFPQFIFSSDPFCELVVLLFCRSLQSSQLESGVNGPAGPTAVRPASTTLTTLESDDDSAAAITLSQTRPAERTTKSKSRVVSYTVQVNTLTDTTLVGPEASRTSFYNVY